MNIFVIAGWEEKVLFAMQGIRPEVLCLSMSVFCNGVSSRPWPPSPWPLLRNGLKREGSHSKIRALF